MRVNQQLSARFLKPLPVGAPQARAAAPRLTARTRNTPLVLLLLASAIFAATAGAQSPGVVAAQRPNILWIIAEDMGPDIGAYGAAGISTPNLDRLAAEGMRFTNAFTTSAICSPSRSAFNTGMYQTTIGAHNHRSHRPDEPGYSPHPLPEGVRITSDWLRPAGYLTADIAHLPEEVGFRGSAHTDWNFTYGGKPFDTDRWSDLRGSQPFYAQINLPEAHRGKNWNESHLNAPRPADPASVRIPPYYPEHPVVRQDWAQYVNSIMVLDQKVGKILAMLDREGLADNTVVIFMADHGQAMVRAKQWLYDSGLRIPLIVRWPSGVVPPSQYRAGGVSDQLISAIDITATTLAIAGVPRPEKMQGRVFLGAGADPPRQYVFGARDRADETVDRVRSVRGLKYHYIRNYFPERPLLQTNRYKETEYPTIWVLREMHAAGRLDSIQSRLMAPTRPVEELYDVGADPHEIRNLAASPAHQAVLGELRAALDQWIEETDDQGRFPEDPRVVAHYERLMKTTYDVRIQKLREQWGRR